MPNNRKQKKNRWMKQSLLSNFHGWNEKTEFYSFSDSAKNTMSIIQSWIKSPSECVIPLFDKMIEAYPNQPNYVFVIGSNIYEALQLKEYKGFSIIHHSCIDENTIQFGEFKIENDRLLQMQYSE